MKRQPKIELLYNFCFFPSSLRRQKAHILIELDLIYLYVGRLFLLRLMPRWQTWNCVNTTSAAGGEKKGEGRLDSQRKTGERNRTQKEKEEIKSKKGGENEREREGEMYWMICMGKEVERRVYSVSTCAWASGTRKTKLQKEQARAGIDS